MARFEIEYVMAEENWGIVVARQLDRGDFLLGPHSTLGGLRVTERLDIPRRALPNRELDLRCFAFQLVEPGDASALAVGQVVELAS